MPRTRTDPKKSKASISSVSMAEPLAAASAEVLTLGEAAAYLRLEETDVLRLVEEQGLPARRLANEWRFLKGAIQDWLRTGAPTRPSKEAQLAVAGAWKDDPFVEEELKEIYKHRGRPMTEDKG
jgi:excisionase family DNA binding protein